MCPRDDSGARGRERAMVRSYRWLLPVLAMAFLLMLVSTRVSVCDDRRLPVKHHTGQPLTIGPEDGPFTKARLIEIARHYYPAIEYAETHASSDEGTRILQATPEWQARRAAHTQAMANRGPWRDLLRTLAASLTDHHVTDRTRWYRLEPAYVVEIVPRDESREGMLVGMVSTIAPVYFIGQSVGDRTLRDPIDPELADAEQALEREILARYPYHRLDHDIGQTIVPEIRADNRGYRESTLVDLLLSDYW